MRNPEKTLNDIQLAMNNLFSKYGMADGEWLYATELQSMFSKYLDVMEFEHEGLSTLHNKRVYAFKINGTWYLTETLAYVMSEDDENWRLVVPAAPDALYGKEPEESIPVPDELKKAILAFVPTANMLCYLTPGTEEYNPKQNA